MKVINNQWQLSSAICPLIITLLTLVSETSHHSFIKHIYHILVSETSNKGALHFCIEIFIQVCIYIYIAFYFFTSAHKSIIFLPMESSIQRGFRFFPIHGQ